jgi:hypothetical protein
MQSILFELLTPSLLPLKDPVIILRTSYYYGSRMMREKRNSLESRIQAQKMARSARSGRFLQLDIGTQRRPYPVQVYPWAVLLMGSTALPPTVHFLEQIKYSTRDPR